MAEDSKTYVPPPSVGHEIGVLFGFLGFMLVCMVIYGVVWTIGNKRSQRREAERVERLKASGLLRGEKEAVPGT
ncbi:hypothetical protein CC78DRAFT_537198 [Lojkania enalia]|uniref:Uncharacterized protein n=1 Tax=Lojkania enalia TaxID=147567 RepID=A0A9P4K0V3_9PLEO|nr:hypothetical protein CC78DRAFT_537198 [Didymosphaeria enalia]